MLVQSSVDLIDVYDQLLELGEQATGKGHALYVSSSTDLECCIVMLSGEGATPDEEFERNETRQYPVYRYTTAH